MSKPLFDLEAETALLAEILGVPENVVSIAPDPDRAGFVVKFGPQSALISYTAAVDAQRAGVALGDVAAMELGAL